MWKKIPSIQRAWIIAKTTNNDKIKMSATTGRWHQPSDWLIHTTHMLAPLISSFIPSTLVTCPAFLNLPGQICICNDPIHAYEYQVKSLGVFCIKAFNRLHYYHKILLARHVKTQLQNFSPIHLISYSLESIQPTN